MRIICFIVAGFFLAAMTPAAGFSQEPNRIVSMNLCTDELLLRLADSGKIKGVTQYPHLPEIEALIEKASNAERIRGRVEEVLALNPDLVLAGTFSYAETIRFLKRIGVPVVVLDIPADFEGIYQNIRTVANAIGEPDRGEFLVQSMREKLEAMPMPIASSRRAVLFQQGGNVPGPGTFEHALLEAAGLENSAIEAGINGRGWVSIETLISLHTDFLILPEPEGIPSFVSGGLLSHPAIRKGLVDAEIVYLDPGLLDCGVPSAIAAVQALSLTVKASAAPEEKYAA